MAYKKLFGTNPTIFGTNPKIDLHPTLVFEGNNCRDTAIYPSKLLYHIPFVKSQGSLPMDVAVALTMLAEYKYFSQNITAEKAMALSEEYLYYFTNIRRNYQLNCICVKDYLDTLRDYGVPSKYSCGRSYYKDFKLPRTQLPNLEQDEIDIITTFSTKDRIFKSDYVYIPMQYREEDNINLDPKYLDRLTEALNLFGPVMVTLPWFKDCHLYNNTLYTCGFESIEYSMSEFVNINKCYEGSESVDGIHTIVIYGYDENGWLAKNTWGNTYGNNGSFIIPYGMTQCFMEAWALISEDEKRDLLNEDNKDIEEVYDDKVKVSFISTIANFFKKIFKKK